MADSSAVLQFFLAHMIRDGKFLAEQNDTVTRHWAERMLKRFAELFRLIHRRDQPPEARFQARLDGLKLCRGKGAPFRDLTFDLVAGDRLVIMAESSSGKSSLLQALLGRAAFGTRVRPTQRMPQVLQRTILVGGLPPERMSAWPSWLAANAGALFQPGALAENSG